MKNGRHTTKNGNELWYKNGQLHREDGPAVISRSGTEYWMQEGKFHRADGPAAEHKFDDTKLYEWWYHGKFYQDLTEYANDSGWGEKKLAEWLLKMGR